ncbi:DUF2971 domain-containing protein [Microbacterium suwonense]|uniref:DUF2971 domain-containing protein n=1 Tax=Microbacterium suwonense TaxID=683047 RepID=A0ABN6X412_9MICO|nr:DUF2971 domain-containing protein [Microbacterium suwonense]BDZ39294.1 hypothetical protein GCM10025863_19080 [Microbacterium suwonense]
MNDTAEIATGQQVIVREVLRYAQRAGEIDGDVQDAIEDAVSNTFERSAFAISFSRSGDDVSQWQRYAGVGGVAIAWKKWHYPVVLDRTGVYESTVNTEIADYPLHWHRMIYSEKKQARASRQALKRAAELMQFGAAAAASFSQWQYANVWAADAITTVIHGSKNRSFRSEREIRYAVGDPLDLNLVHESLSGRKYVELTGGRELHAKRIRSPEYSTRSPSPLPIAAVRLGPGVDRDTESLVQDAMYPDYLHAPILRSSSTLRT